MGLSSSCAFRALDFKKIIAQYAVMLAKFRAFAQTHTAEMIVLGYFFYALIGWFLLSLPFSQIRPVHMFDNLFTAASAASTAGLESVPVSTSYSFFGQLVILILMQYGGLGYMTFSTFVILATTHRLSGYREKMAEHTFELPKDFSIR